jgi:CheY-like chemotaxis protein
MRYIRNQEYQLCLFFFGLVNSIAEINFMDIQMPVKNGYEETKEIRKLKAGASISIIAITAGTGIELNNK